MKKMLATLLVLLAACDGDEPSLTSPASPDAPASSLASAYGMVKPVTALRDYNGTYTGAPGTGTVGYTTLYRDNYDGGAASGCNGEGCGRHPGVDIPVPSGTAVYASISGTVVQAGCTTNGWGGRVVIRSTNPYNAAEVVYATYAHLRNTADGAAKLNQYVSAGTRLGYSGGGSGDYCPGNSTGAHLHFQVDKNDGNFEPYFPTSSGVNPSDAAFGVMQYTHNPVPFVTGGYHWSFSQAGNYEFWSAPNVASSGVGDDALWIDGGSDPWIWRQGTVPASTVGCSAARPCSANIAAEASIYRYVKLDMFNHCYSNPLKIYFKTAASDSWDEAKSVSFNLANWGAASGTFYMGGNSQWSGIITAIRIDPASNCTPNAFDPNYFGYITLQQSAS